MSTQQLETYRVYACFVKRLLVLGGIHSEKRERNVLYRQVSTISILTSAIVLCSIANSCVHNIKNLSVLIKSFGMFGSASAVTLKALLFRVHGKELSVMNKILDKLCEDTLKKPQLRSILLSLLRFFYRSSYALVFLTTGTTVVYFMQPLIRMARHVGSNETLKPYSLPYPTTYPWSVGDSLLIYQLHYIFEAQFSWFLVCTTCAADTQFGFYTFQISALLRVVTHKFESLQPSDNVKETIRNCVEEHVRLLQCKNIIQKVYGPIVLLMAVTNAVMMCTFVFQAFQSNGMSVDKATMLVLYMILKVWQTFMYAWGGHIMTVESEVLQRQAYYAGWYEHEEKNFAKSILLVTVQRPITLSACYFFKISLDFFVKFLNTTISYFFLLQTLDDKQ